MSSVPPRRNSLRISLWRPAAGLMALLAVILSVQPGASRPGLAAGFATTIPSAIPTPTPTATTTSTPAPTNTPVPTTTAAPPSPTVTVAPSASPTAGPPTPVPEPTFSQHYVVLIVIDAARPDYLTRWRLPHIDSLMKHGVVYDRASVGELLSSTPGVHVTFGTGTQPRENGFLGFGWAAPGSRRQVDFRTLLADGQIEPVLRRLPLPSVAARLHQFFPHARSVAASGHKDYAVVGLGGGSADYEIYGKYDKKRFLPTALPGHTAPPLTAAQRRGLTLTTPLPVGSEDNFAFRYATDVVSRVKPRLLMINLPEVDSWGHWRGPDDHKFFHRLLLNVDRGIGQIQATYRKLGILKNTDFIITSDHAMMESIAAHNWGTLRTAATAVKAKVVRGDTEAGAVWLQNPTQAKAVADQLVKLHPAHVGAIFYRSAPGNQYEYLQDSPMGWLVNAQAGAALKHLVDTTAGQDGPDLWVLYRENYTVVPRNVAGTWKGTHGGATWQVQHVPLIISGPGVRSGVHLQFPAYAIDIAPTMERLLGLPSLKRDGVVLANALKTPTQPEVQAQQSVAASRTADVIALQQESKFDTTVAKNRLRRTRSLPQCKGSTKASCEDTSKTATNS